MKQYKSPKIKVVQLDSKQSVLQVCQVGGIYLYYDSFSHVTMCNTATSEIGPQCQSTPKGGVGGNTRISVANSAKAS